MSLEGQSAVKEALAGSAASVFANTIVYPLDIVKTRLQIEHKGEDKRNGPIEEIRSIIARHGITGLYRGLGSSLMGTGSTAFAYFFWYRWTRSSYQERVSRARGIGTAEELLLGAIAGFLAQLCTIPVSVCTTRQQTSEQDLSLWESVKEILHQDGWTGLYTGLKPSIVLCSNPAITYGLFSRIEGIVAKGKKGARMTPGEAFFVGALAKSIATVVTFPYIMAKTRMQSRQDSGEHNSAIEILSKVYKKDGIRGWFFGLEAQISKAVLTQAILFYYRQLFTQYTILAIVLLRRLITSSRIKS